MALAGRSRRGSGRTWIVVGLIVTILVLLVDASIKSRSQAPARELSGQAWLERVDPIITQSNVVADDLQALRTGSTSVTSTALSTKLTTMRGDARSAYTSFRKLAPPPSNLSNASGLLGTVLYVRQKATTEFVAAMTQQLSAAKGTPPTAAAQAMLAAVGQLEIADKAYTLFSQDIPAGVGNVTTSQFVPQPNLYTQDKLEVWLTSMSSRTSLAAVRQLSIVALSTSPGPLRESGGVETLPAGKVNVQVVVGNIGNQPASDVHVQAIVAPATATTLAASSHVVYQLAPGDDTTVRLDGLGPKVGVPITLTVTVVPQTGSGMKMVTRVIKFIMPSPTSATTTTTTTTPTGTTTVPHNHKTKAKGHRSSSSTTSTTSSTVTTVPGG